MLLLFFIMDVIVKNIIVFSYLLKYLRDILLFELVNPARLNIKQSNFKLHIKIFTLNLSCYLVSIRS